MTSANPYSLFHGWLSSLPPEGQILLSKTFFGPLDDEPDTKCGCLFGTFFGDDPWDDAGPNGRHPGRDGDGYVVTELPGFVENRAAHNPSFSMWLWKQGIPMHVAVELERESDNFEDERNERMDAARRYNHMLDYTARRAEEWDQGIVAVAVQAQDNEDDEQE